MIEIAFSPDELMALRSLINSAVQHEGMRVAAIAVAIDKKILDVVRMQEGHVSSAQRNGGEARPLTAEGGS